MRDLQSMREMMDRFFQEAFGSFGQLSGQGFPVDFAENDNAYLVRASLPGIKPEDTDITIEGNPLTIRGETRADHQQQEQRWIRREHHDVSFFLSVYGKLSVLRGEPDHQARAAYEQALAVCARLGERLYAEQIEQALVAVENRSTT